MVYSSFSKLRILQLRWQGERASSIAAVLKWEVFKVTVAMEESAFYSGRAKWEVFKVTVAMEESAFYSGRA